MPSVHCPALLLPPPACLQVGLLQALSAVDHNQALLLAEDPHPDEEQQWAGTAGLVPSAAYASNSYDSELDSVIFTDASGQPFSPRSLGGSRGAFPAAAAACRAGGSSSTQRGGLRWRQQQGSLGSGCWGAFAARSGVVAHAFIETSNAYSSGSSGSSIDSLDSEGSTAAAGSSSSSGAMAAKRVDSNARNSVVALHGGHATMLSGSSSGSANGNSNGSAVNGSSSPSGSTCADAEPLLQGKPQRAAAGASASEAQQPGVGDAAAAGGQVVAGWRPPAAMQGIVRLVTQPGPTTADATWQLVPVSSNRVGLLNAAGQPLPLLAADAAGQRLQALPMPAQGPCIVGGALDR